MQGYAKWLDTVNRSWKPNKRIENKCYTMSELFTYLYFSELKKTVLIGIFFGHWKPFNFTFIAADVRNLHMRKEQNQEKNYVLFLHFYSFSIIDFSLKKITNKFLMYFSNSASNSCKYTASRKQNSEYYHQLSLQKYISPKAPATCNLTRPPIHPTGKHFQHQNHPRNCCSLSLSHSVFFITKNPLTST